MKPDCRVDSPVSSFSAWNSHSKLFSYLAKKFRSLATYGARGFSPASAQKISLRDACDIGLLGIPDSVIEQGPNQSGPDREIYYQHTVLGHALFSTGMTDGRHLADHAAEIAYWHHKRYDGGGFPADDPPGSIPLSAQLTHTALLLLEYADYFEDHADPIQRALRALAGDVGHAISQEMYTSAHAACAALSALLPFQK